MTDFARLQIAVDSRQIKQAERDLRDFTRTSQKTTAQTKKMEKATKDASNAKREMADRAKRLERGLKALGLGIAITAMVRFTKSTLAAADEIGKLARQTGIAAESLQAWDFAASQNGVRADSLRGSMERLARYIGDARAGTGEFAKVANELGIELTSAESVVYDIADAIKNAADEADQARIAAAAFGRSGMEMVRMLQGGSAGLQEFERRARSLGIVLSNEMIRKSEMFNDQMDILGRQIRTAFQSGLLDGFLRDFDETSSAVMDPELQEALRTIGELIGNIGRMAGSAAGDLAKLTAAILNLLSAPNLTADEIAGVQERELQRLELRRAALTDAVANHQAAIVSITAHMEKLRETETAPSVLDAIQNQLDARRDAIGLIGQEIIAVEEQIVAIKGAEEATKEATEATVDYTESLDEAAVAADTFAQELQQLVDRLDPAAAATRKFMSDVDLLNRAWAEGMNSERYLQLMDELTRGTLEAAEAAEELADSAEPMSRAWNDALVDVDRAFVSLFESAFRGFENFADQLKSAFTRLLANLAYEAARRRIMISLGMGGAPGGAMAGGMDPGSLLGMGKNLAGAGGFMSAMGTGFGMAAQNIGAAGYFGAAGANLSMAGSSAMAGAWGTAIGAAAPYLLPALAVGVAIAGGAFSRKHKESGVMGTFDGGDVTANQYDFYKGGMFRSNKTKIGDANPQFAAELRNLQQGTISMANALGLGGDAINEFTGEVKVNFKNLSPEEAAQKMRDEMAKLQQRMVETIPGIEDFTYAGQRAGEAFRLLAEDTNQLMEGLGITTDAIADILLQGMTGRMTEAQVGEQLADLVIGGVYNAIASDYAQQIASVFQQQILSPIFAAITAGVPLSQAISQGAISAVVATAQQAAANIAAIFNDPGFRAAIGAIEGAIKGISGAVAIRVPRFSAPRPRSMPSAPKRDEVGDERKRLELELLRLQENEAELRRRERAELHWSNRALFDRIKALEDEKEALRELTAASRGVVDEIQRLRGEQVGMSQAGLMARFATLTAQARSGDTEALEKLPELSRLLETSGIMMAGTAADVARMRAWLTRSLEDTLKALGLEVPEFARGGDHLGGLRVVGEQGPELESTGPSRITSTSAFMGAMRGDAVVRELGELRAEVVALRRDQARSQFQIAKQTKRTSDTLRLWDAEGMPEQREAVTP